MPKVTHILVSLAMSPEFVPVDLLSLFLKEIIEQSEVFSDN